MTYESSGSSSDKQSAVDALAAWITSSSKAMISDYQKGSGSIASRFTSADGYSTSQWNEFFGTVANDADSNVHYNNNGVADGVTVNGQLNKFIIDDPYLNTNGNGLLTNWG